MPKLTIPRRCTRILKELKVYDIWLINVKRIWATDDNELARFAEIGMADEQWTQLIWRSFTWSLTPDGFDFWNDINKKYERLFNSDFK